MRTIKTALALTSAMAISACNKVGFRPPQEDSTAITTSPSTPTTPTPTTTSPVCRVENVAKTRPVNIVFIVDQSGSNLNGPYEHPGAATDPQKILRTQIINNFMRDHGAQSNLHWSLITFNDASANALVKTSSGAPAYTNSLDVMKSAMADFATRPDVGKTPYRAALAMAAQMIRADGASSDPNSLTMIAFITDGYPTDYCPGGIAQYECPGQIMESAIDADVASVVNASNGLVQMGTVYYGAQDADASARLQRMATHGNGQFVDLNKMGQIDLNDIMQVPQTICE